MTREESGGREDFHSDPNSLTPIHSSWGVVWRAYLTIPEFPVDPSRVICWQRPGYSGKNGLIVLNLPLEMFDPKAWVKSLDTE